MREDFWPGFAAGAAAGTLLSLGAVLSWRSRSASRDQRVLRLEKSINIGCPVQRVFSTVLSLEDLPRWIGFVKAIEEKGKRSRWAVEIDGRRMEWSARITQVVPNESIAWKSVSGAKHTGRVTFSPLGDQTVVHVVMNYAPRQRHLGSLIDVSQELDHWIARGLREFKASLESEERGRARATRGKSIRRGYSAPDSGKHDRLHGSERRTGIK